MQPACVAWTAHLCVQVPHLALPAVCSGKRKGGIWAGWEARCAADSQFAYKVAIEQVRIMVLLAQWCASDLQPCTPTLLDLSHLAAACVSLGHCWLLAGLLVLGPVLPGRLTGNSGCSSVADHWRGGCSPRRHVLAAVLGPVRAGLCVLHTHCKYRGACTACCTHCSMHLHNVTCCLKEAQQPADL